MCVILRRIEWEEEHFRYIYVVFDRGLHTCILIKFPWTVFPILSIDQQHANHKRHLIKNHFKQNQTNQIVGKIKKKDGKYLQSKFFMINARINVRKFYSKFVRIQCSVLNPAFFRTFLQAVLTLWFLCV